MKLLIFKTNIKSRKKVRYMKPVFNNHPVINNWNIDLEDIDNVLRIETSGSLNEKEVIHLINNYGFQCEALPD